MNAQIADDALLALRSFRFHQSHHYAHNHQTSLLQDCQSHRSFQQLDSRGQTSFTFDNQQSLLALIEDLENDNGIMKLSNSSLHKVIITPDDLLSENCSIAGPTIMHNGNTTLTLDDLTSFTQHEPSQKERRPFLPMPQLQSLSFIDQSTIPSKADAENARIVFNAWKSESHQRRLRKLWLIESWMAAVRMRKVHLLRRFILILRIRTQCKLDFEKYNLRALLLFQVWRRRLSSHLEYHDSIKRLLIVGVRFKQWLKWMRFHRVLDARESMALISIGVRRQNSLLDSYLELWKSAYYRKQSLKQEANVCFKRKYLRSWTCQIRYYCIVPRKMCSLAEEHFSHWKTCLERVRKLHAYIKPFSRLLDQRAKVETLQKLQKIGFEKHCIQRANQLRSIRLVEMLFKHWKTYTKAMIRSQLYNERRLKNGIIQILISVKQRTDQLQRPNSYLVHEFRQSLKNSTFYRLLFAYKLHRFQKYAAQSKLQTCFVAIWKRRQDLLSRNIKEKSHYTKLQSIFMKWKQKHSLYTIDLTKFSMIHNQRRIIMFYRWRFAVGFRAHDYTLAKKFHLRSTFDRCIALCNERKLAKAEKRLQLVSKFLWFHNMRMKYKHRKKMYRLRAAAEIFNRQRLKLEVVWKLKDFAMKLGRLERVAGLNSQVNIKRRVFYQARLIYGKRRVLEQRHEALEYVKAQKNLLKRLYNWKLEAKYSILTKNYSLITRRIIIRIVSNIWVKWISETNCHRIAKQVSKDLILACWRQWKRMSTINVFHNLVAIRHEIREKRHVISVWKAKAEQNLHKYDVEEIAVQRNGQYQMITVHFRRWLIKHSHTTTMKRRAKNFQHYLALYKYLFIWRRRIDKIEKMKRFPKVLAIFVKSQYLKIWQRRLYDVIHLRLLAGKAGYLRFISIHLDKWRFFLVESMRRRLLAVNFHKQSIQVKYLKQMRLKYREQGFYLKIATSTLCRITFGLRNKQLYYSELIYEFQKRSLYGNHFAQWRSKCETVKSYQKFNVIELFHYQNLCRYILDKWIAASADKQKVKQLQAEWFESSSLTRNSFFEWKRLRFVHDIRNEQSYNYNMSIWFNKWKLDMRYGQILRFLKTEKEFTAKRIVFSRIKRLKMKLSFLRQRHFRYELCKNSAVKTLSGYDTSSLLNTFAKSSKTNQILKIILLISLRRKWDTFQKWKCHMRCIKVLDQLKFTQQIQRKRVYLNTWKRRTPSKECLQIQKTLEQCAKRKAFDNWRIQAYLSQLLVTEVSLRRRFASHLLKIWRRRTRISTDYEHNSMMISMRYRKRKLLRRILRQWRWLEGKIANITVNCDL